MDVEAAMHDVFHIQPDLNVYGDSGPMQVAYPHHFCGQPDTAVSPIMAACIIEAKKSSGSGVLSVLL